MPSGPSCAKKPAEGSDGRVRCRRTSAALGPIDMTTRGGSQSSRPSVLRKTEAFTGRSHVWLLPDEICAVKEKQLTRLRRSSSCRAAWFCTWPTSCISLGLSGFALESRHGTSEGDRQMPPPDSGMTAVDGGRARKLPRSSRAGPMSYRHVAATVGRRAPFRTIRTPCGAPDTERAGWRPCGLLGSRRRDS